MKVLLIFGFYLVGFLAIPNEVCPICHSLMTKSFPSKEDNGRSFYKYVCTNNHEVWIEDEFNQTTEDKIKSSNNSDCQCPVCGWHGYLTGTLHLKKCSKGHEFKCD